MSIIRSTISNFKILITRFKIKKSATRLRVARGSKKERMRQHPLNKLLQNLLE